MKYIAEQYRGVQHRGVEFSTFQHYTYIWSAIQCQCQISLNKLTRAKPGLLYKHCCHTLINYFVQSPSSSPGFTAPPSPKGLRWCFQAWNRLCCTGLENHKKIKVNLNCIIGNKVMAILLNGWILSIGGFSSGRVCACSLHSRLVSWLGALKNDFLYIFM